MTSPTSQKEGRLHKHDDALILGALLDGRGGARELSWDEIERWTPDSGVLWMHIHLDEPRAREWLNGRSGLDPLVCDALLSEQTRPRVVPVGDGMLIMLRGVNLNPGASPDDMVSVRLWVDAQRVITVRRRKLMAVQELVDSLDQGRGPRDAAGFLLQLTENLTTRMGPAIAALHEQLGEIEEEVHVKRDAEIRSRLSNARRTIIGLRRFIAPQRETFMQISRERPSWFDLTAQMAMRETAYDLTRHLEDLDVAREQAIVTHDELTAYVGEQLGRTMYLLALVTVFFLPVTFITGLLGMNIGGVPGVPPEKYPAAFVIVLLIMGALAVVQAWFFRRLKVMR